MSTPEPLDDFAEFPLAETRGGDHLADITVAGEEAPVTGAVCDCGCEDAG